jgi:superfamily II DNA helicase RecQ
MRVLQQKGPRNLLQQFRLLNRSHHPRGMLSRSSARRQRASISYSVRRLTLQEATDDGLALLVKHYLQRLTQGQKMVVFAGSIAKVIRIAALTQLPLYYHGLKDKQKQLIEFMRSSSAIITISSGINIPNLSIVLHLPIAIHGLMEFSQEFSTLRHALLDVQDFLASPSADPTKSH